MANYNAILDVTFNNGTITEPLSLEDAKLYMRVDVDADDALITSLIKSAREVLENYTNVSFIPRQVTAVICNLCGNQYLPYGPVTGSVTLTDKDGNAITDSLIRGEAFKFIEAPKYDYIKAVYNAGYTNSNIPSHFVTALKMQVLYMYDNRGDLQVAPTVKSILSNARKL